MPKTIRLGEKPRKVLELHVANLQNHTSLFVSSKLPTNYEPHVLLVGLTLPTNLRTTRLTNSMSSTTSEPHVYKRSSFGEE